MGEKKNIRKFLEKSWDFGCPHFSPVNIRSNNVVSHILIILSASEQVVTVKGHCLCTALTKGALALKYAFKNWW